MEVKAGARRYTLAPLVLLPGKAGEVHCANFLMSGDLSAFPRLPIVIGEKRLQHFAECEPASCPLVGRAVSCLRVRVLLTGQN